MSNGKKVVHTVTAEQPAITGVALNPCSPKSCADRAMDTSSGADGLEGRKLVGILRRTLPMRKQTYHSAHLGALGLLIHLVLGLHPVGLRAYYSWQGWGGGTPTKYWELNLNRLHSRQAPQSKVLSLAPSNTAIVIYSPQKYIMKLYMCFSEGHYVPPRVSTRQLQRCSGNFDGCWAGVPPCPGWGRSHSSPQSQIFWPPKATCKNQETLTHHKFY